MPQLQNRMSMLQWRPIQPCLRKLSEVPDLHLSFHFYVSRKRFSVTLVSSHLNGVSTKLLRALRVPDTKVLRTLRVPDRELQHSSRQLRTLLPTLRRGRTDLSLRMSAVPLAIEAGPAIISLHRAEASGGTHPATVGRLSWRAPCTLRPPWGGVLIFI